jgi:hypothetical protein
MVCCFVGHRRGFDVFLSIADEATLSFGASKKMLLLRSYFIFRLRVVCAIKMSRVTHMMTLTLFVMPLIIRLIMRTFTLLCNMQPRFKIGKLECIYMGNKWC